MMKVIAVHILILEKTNIETDCVQLGFSDRSSLVNIPIAGFVVGNFAFSLEDNN